ncbi:MAG: gamma-glutamylcyclotransferase [Blautia sp.]|nr:gamma-glutamylcyclotransferase [Blautia sp.]MCM1201758.1 gamma-glutamylcyclotransferase [Bacteroides fragilis]
MKKMFVYGTLRVGMYNYEKYYQEHDSFRQNAYVKGTLHTLKGKVYPALTEGTQMVAGEIHEVPDAVQDEVDLMEGFFGEGVMENEYDKTVSDIYDADGNVIDRLPVYFYNVRNAKNRELLGDVIAGNDYVAYLQEKQNRQG